MKGEEVKKIVKETYGDIANKGCSCNCNPSMTTSEISIQIGYSENQIKAVPEANLGLGCGNPTALGKINEGETVLDLGSGAGFDSFLAAKKVGDSGRVIGVDMTEQMVEKARNNAAKYGYRNVEFRSGDIEELPVEDDSVDVIISNCVINLAPDKSRVFKEAYRVLKYGGRMYVSDIVLLKELTEEQKKDSGLLTGCISGALLKDDYLEKIKNAGFKVNILSETRNLNVEHTNDLDFESLNIEATKSE
jgi:arsenite methyltransferase